MGLLALAEIGRFRIAHDNDAAVVEKVEKAGQLNPRTVDIPGGYKNFSGACGI